MHELSITQSMFDLVLEQAKQHNAVKVTKMNLVIGELTGVVGDSVQFYLEFLSKGTVAEGAALNIRNIPAQAACRKCKNIFRLPEMEWICPECKEASLEITGGTELFLESIEVE